MSLYDNSVKQLSRIFKLYDIMKDKKRSDVNFKKYLKLKPKNQKIEKSLKEWFK